MAKIRVAQAYTGPIGSEIIRRLADHKTMELVGVLVHSVDKVGRDSGELAGGAPNGIVTTRSLDELIALKPHGIIWSGSQRWTWAARAGGREFYQCSNEQTTVLGIADGWRTTYYEPAYTV